MDWNDTSEQAEFRARVRSVIEEKLPERYRRAADDDGQQFRGVQGDRKSDKAEVRQAADDWTHALDERGWVAPAWPKDYGGAGLSPMDQFIYNQEMAQAGAPSVGGMGVQMLGPTLIVHGTEEQKKQYLPKILSGETSWAQGYSEPGSGSDLASLQTRAVRDGDDYVINGQKIWTSGAHNADSLFALTRTDVDAPKHRGISFLLIDDIHQPGLTVRPLINMGWEHGFNEVFFEDVRTPVKNIIGEENRGWYVGATLLDFERSNISGAVTLRRTIKRLLDYVQTDEGRAKSRLAGSDSVRHEIAERYIETEVQFQFSFRIISMQAAGQIPNYEAPTAKLFNSEANQKLARSGTKVFGQYAQIWTDAKDGPEYAPMKAAFTRSYVSTVPSTIAGGTSEIQRNIIATRGLGLPRG